MISYHNEIDKKAKRVKNKTPLRVKLRGVKRGMKVRVSFVFHREIRDATTTRSAIAVPLMGVTK